MIKKITLILLIFIMLLSSFSGISFAGGQAVSPYIDELDSNEYPQIKEMIKELQSEHPNWKFKILYTGLNWSDVISNEYTNHGSSPRNLIPASSSYSDEWICSICGERTYDNGSWRCASEVAIQYMMDPRNSLNPSDIFQFLELSYTDYNLDTVKGMLSGSNFLNNDSYINAIISACQEYNVNVYYIIARILQEQGNDGSTLVKGEGYNGQYVGVYNVFNINASGSGKENVIINGLKEAQKQGWTSIESSIKGGIETIANQYIGRGQNTIYLQKFDVDSSDGSLYWHQYMQNLMAAQNEGAKLKSTFETYGSLESEYTFIIPVYENMPTSASRRPNSTATDDDVIISTNLVKCNANPSLRMRSTPAGADTGERIYYDEIVTRVEKATEKVNGTYWDLVRKSNGTEGYVARETSDDEDGYKLYLIPLNEESETSDENNNDDIVKNEKIKVNNTLSQVTSIPNATVSELKELMGTTEVTVKNANGEVVSDDSKLATGYVVNDKYTISVIGDANGDGKINSGDLFSVQKYLINGETEISTSLKKAMDVNKDNKINSGDLFNIQKYLLGKSGFSID